MNKKFGIEFFVSMLLASLSYLFGFMLLKNCIEPAVVSAEVMGHIPMIAGEILVYGFFIGNMALFMLVHINTHALLMISENNDKIYE